MYKPQSSKKEDENNKKPSQEEVPSNTTKTDDPKPQPGAVPEPEKVDGVSPQDKPRNFFTPKIQQYKRTCKACGKVWYSLKSREAELEKRAGNGCCCNNCGTCTDIGAQLQADRNREATEEQLLRLRMCPSCNSGVYDEVVEDFQS